MNDIVLIAIVLTLPSCMHSCVNCLITRKVSGKIIGRYRLILHLNKPNLSVVSASQF